MQLSDFSSFVISQIRDGVEYVNEHFEGKVAVGMPESVTIEVLVGPYGDIDENKAEKNQHKLIVTFPVSQNSPHEKTQ